MAPAEEGLQIVVVTAQKREQPLQKVPVAVNYLGGLFYSDARSDRSSQRGPVALLANWSAHGGNKSVAAFAQGDYRLTPATRFSAGVRLNRETNEVDFTDRQPVTPAVLIVVSL